MWRRLFQPIDVASLVVFRVFFGAILLWEVGRYFTYDWIALYWIEPAVHFTYLGFDWVRPWPGSGMYVHFAALGVLALAIALGAFYRVAAALFFFGFGYVFLLEQTHYLNHFYLILILAGLLLFLPAHRAFSVDAWRKPALRSDTVPALAVTVLRLQIAGVYFFAGVAKLNVDWLLGEPMRPLLASRVADGAIPVFFATEPMVYAISYGGLFLDLLAGPMLWWSRTRPLAFLAVTGFHLSNAWLFPIGIFPWFMIAASTIFFRPDWPRRLLRRAPAEIDAEAPIARGALPGLALGLVLLHFTVQALVPLRHWLYPGPVAWTEEGHRFAWRMMLRSKTPQPRFVQLVVIDPASGETRLDDAMRALSPEQVSALADDPDALEALRAAAEERWQREIPGARVEVSRRLVRLTAVDPETGRAWNVDPRRYVPLRVEDTLARDPGLLQQLAQHVAHDLQERLGARVEVRVEAWASLHGRAMQPLIDPRVDLAATRRGLAPADWIVPLRERWPPRRDVSALLESARDGAVVPR